MEKTWDELEKELKKIKKAELILKMIEENPGYYRHMKLSSEGIKLDRAYYYHIKLDGLIFELELAEKDGILFSNFPVQHFFDNFGICPFCNKYSKSNVICKSLTDYLGHFLHFFKTQHPSSRVKLLTDPVIQGKEIVDAEIAFNLMTSLKYNKDDNWYYELDYM